MQSTNLDMGSTHRRCCHENAIDSIQPTRLAASRNGARLYTLFIQPANAGCLDVPTAKHASYQNPEAYFRGARLVKVDLKQDDGWVPGFFQAPIVGLWAFTYTASAGNVGIPAGAIIDAGNTLWFADGNEITYFGIRRCGNPSPAAMYEPAVRIGVGTTHRPAVGYQ